MWLRKVTEILGQKSLKIHWQPFSLEQVNSNESPEWKVWDQPTGYRSRGLLALWAGEAARRQGTDAFNDFLTKLLIARHEERKKINERDVILQVAQSTGLDMRIFQKDLLDTSLLTLIGESHVRAVNEYGIFGVPTFVFQDGGTAYLKMFAPPDDKAVSIWEDLVNIMSKWGTIGEIKRPQPPWPKGIYH